MKVFFLLKWRGCFVVWGVWVSDFESCVCFGVIGCFGWSSFYFGLCCWNVDGDDDERVGLLFCFVCFLWGVVLRMCVVVVVFGWVWDGYVGCVWE